MKGILLLNGQPYTQPIDAENAYVVCCDGAYAWAKDKVKIDENVGDFDSLNYLPTPPPQEIYPSEKNYTDGEIGLKRLIERGCDQIEIYGACGGREDHFLGNLHLLYYAKQSKLSVKILTETVEIYPIEKEAVIRGGLGRTFSLFPFGGNAHIIKSEGLKYPLHDLTLYYGSCRGVSNVIVSEQAKLFCDKGMLLAFVNKK